MAIKVRIIGTVEEEHDFPRFPTDPELERLRLARGRYSSIKDLQFRLDGVLKYVKFFREDCEITYKAVIRNRKPSFTLRAEK